MRRCTYGLNGKHQNMWYIINGAEETNMISINLDCEETKSLTKIYNIYSMV